MSFTIFMKTNALYKIQKILITTHTHLIYIYAFLNSFNLQLQNSTHDNRQKPPTDKTFILNISVLL